MALFSGGVLQVQDRNASSKQIVSDGCKSLADLDAKETTEFLSFLDHQFAGDEDSFVF
jgi:hypothetical protein